MCSRARSYALEPQVEHNPEYAHQLLRKAVVLGDPAAHVLLGILYSKGIGIKKDPERVGSRLAFCCPLF